jgi:PBP1b-binding outer membrane lipoprotein LpoB
MKNYIILLTIVFILAGCTNKTNQTTTKATTTNQSVKTTVTSDECSSINKLINGYEFGFNSIKTDKVNNPFSNQWRTNTHIIGSACTITLNKSEQVSYQCQTPVKAQTHAVNSHQTLAEQLRQCLSKTGWFESQKETASSIYSTFVLDTKNPVITLSTNQEGNGFSTRFEIAPPLGF